MEWIKCSDRLPDDNVEVLVFDVDIGIFILAINPDFMDGITHWQPLPEPPKD